MMWNPINQRFFVLLCFLASTLVAQAGELTQCNLLSELNCIKTPACTLVQKGVNDYQCRGAVGKCEVDFIQWGEKQIESCETKPGCKYVPGNCYCPPDVLCRCGGGKPPQCVEEN
jgi:hypothetical protein